METSKKIVCVNPKCRAELKRPNAPFIKCPNCRTDFFVFCHEFPFKLFQYVQCNKCVNELYYFFCFKCSGLLSYTKYRMGSISTCRCGFQGCYVVCGNCKKPECFPPDRRYEGIAWKCSGCKQPFDFMTCDQCFHQVYQPKFEAGKHVSCVNKSCRAYLNIRLCKVCNFIFADSKGHDRCEPCLSKQPPAQHNNVQPQGIAEGAKPEANIGNASSSTSGTSKPVSDDACCKVCLDKEANYINTTCFHMSVCEQCVKAIKQQCPLCRAKGEYRRVFK